MIALDPSAWLASALAVGLLSAAATRQAMGYARRRAILDMPGARRSHAVPTPRGGGVGIVLAVLVALAVLHAVTGGQTAWFGSVGFGLAVVAAIGWLDDHRPLPIWPRLAVHAVASAVFAIALYGWPQDAIGAMRALLVAGGVVAMINVWNFMDGIDGLAASQAALVAAAVACVGLPAGASWGVAALWVAAGAAGFLPYNLPRARIFLGDVGSGALGFLVAVLLLSAVADGRLAWPLAPLLVSAFAIDAGLTLAMRVLRGKRWWRPHREHLYQWAVRRGTSHPRVTLAYALWTICVATLSLAVTSLWHDLAVLFAGSVVMLGIAIWFGWRHHMWRMVREG